MDAKNTPGAVDLAAPPPVAGSSLALGIERIGLLPLRHPLLVGLIALLLALGAGFGLPRLKVDDSLSQLFRSDTAEFRQFEETTRRFPSAEYDVLAVIEGDRLLTRDALSRLRDFVTDAQLIDGVRGVISLYSAREPEPGGGSPGPLFPDPLPEGEAFDRLIARAQANEILRGKLLSQDGRLTLVVLALDPQAVEAGSLKSAMEEIRHVMTQAFEGSGLSARLSGVPVMQLEIREAVERDRIVYNAAGFLAGCLIAIAFFRRASFMVVAAGPPLAAILLALGALGWLGFRLNMFLNVMTPLIMVISFADSMQLTFAARDRLLAGRGRLEALREAVLIAGPACVLTHATAALSFLALIFSSSEAIRRFGEAGLLATGVALFAVLMLLPLLGALLLRDEAELARSGRGGDFGVEALRRVCFWIAARMVRRPGLYSAAGLAVVAALAAVFAGLEPRYRLADQVPDKEQAVSASGALDARLAGANPIDVLIVFPPGASLYAPQTLEVIDAVHTALETQPGVGNVWSIDTLRRWLRDKLGDSDVATLRKYVGRLPEHLTRRFVAADGASALVTGRVPDADASRLLPLVEALDRKLDAVRAAHPGYEIAVTGLSAIAARNSASMIGKLAAGLTFEFFFVAAFIGLAFRSARIGLACVPPGIFPVVASGALLAATGQGLQFASVVALTVSFGLGLSATIHFLNRLRLATRAGADYALAVEQATVLVGPALILTSIVLACGLAVTVVSDLPSLRLFGWLSAFSMLAALVADLFILRPLVMVLHRGRRAPSGSRP
ncbi:RND family transporter [Methylocella sp.]|uniref:RND family transporter n=1 Tax=Methylocella sp. TaxID=1978226 RepID=UPI00378323F9